MDSHKPSYQELEDRLYLLETEFERYKQIVNQFLKYSPFYVFMKDENMRATFLTENYKDLLNKPITELLHKPMEQIFPPEFAEQMLKDDAEVLQNNTIIDKEEHFNQKIYRTIKFPILLPDKTKLVGGYSIDITETKTFLEKIKRSKELFKNFFELSPIGIRITDSNGMVINQNKKMEEIYEVPTNEVIGKYIWDIITDNTPTEYKTETLYEDVKSQCKNILIAQKFPEHLQNRDTTIQTRNGKIKHIKTNYIPAKIDEQLIIYTINQDITKEKIAELDLIKAKNIAEEQERRYRLFAENSSDVIWQVDKYLNFTYISPGFEKYTGYSPEEFANIKLEQLYSPENLQKIKSLLNKYENEYLATKINNSHSIEIESIRKDGSIMEIEITAKFVLDEDKNILGIQGATRDITDRRKTETIIRKFKKAVESSKACIVITNLEGNIEYANPAFTETTGYLPHEYLNQNPRVLKSGTHADEFYMELWQTIKDGNTWEGKICNKNKSGELYWEKVIISSIFDATNKICNFVAVKTNINQTIKLTEELAIAKEKAIESDNLKSAFLNNISHEVRTPLNAIVGFSQLLSYKINNIDKLKRFIDNIAESSNKLITTIDDVIDVSQIHSKQIKVNYNYFNFITVINELKYEFEKEMLDRKLKFVLNISSNLQVFEIVSDRMKIYKIYKHLLSNAIKFTYQGSITIDIDLQDTEIKFEISDTGIGIPKEMQTKVFEPFRQADTGNSRIYGGSGVGLSIAKGYTELLDGKIILESEPNKGTKITVSIPLNKTKYNLAKRNIYNRQKVINFDTVLIVEDEISNYELLVEHLKRLNVEYLYARNGQEAIDFCKENSKINLVLMDIKMPVLDGNTATRLIKVFRPDLYIIALTSQVNLLDKENLITYGYNDFICKPIMERDLFDAMLRVC